ncbi:hypothetical protein [Luteolibacter sp. Populi]
MTAQFRELPADQKQAIATQVSGSSSNNDRTLEFRRFGTCGGGFSTR